jgi:glycogen phosphorylase
MSEKKTVIRKLTPSTNPFKGTDPKSLMFSFVNHVEYSLEKDEYSATRHDLFKGLALAVRDRLVERWIETQQTYYRKPSKRVYYLSLEFLMGRTLGNAILNLGLGESVQKALHELGLRLEELEETEFDAGLGNGGLGRLAACFMDSMATLGLPAYGYGIRYEYGIFFQRIRDGYQVEKPDNWLRYGNPWEVDRPEHLYPVRFYGRVERSIDAMGRLRCDWLDAEEVMAMAYDTPVPGYRNDTVNNLRLWAAKSTREFDFDYFNHGDYERAVADKDRSETISKVLYPNDNVFLGRELRLKQEYFFVSATLQDIIRRYKKTRSRQKAADAPESSTPRGRENSSPRPFELFPEEVAIQLNDTHPAVAIPELMRLLVDGEGLGWDEAWEITVKTFGYTNHTILPEALEKWPVGLFEKVLPRHLEIIYEINRRFLDDLSRRHPGDVDRMRRTSIIEEGGEKRIRMAQLAIIGSHSVNGVSELHSGLLRNEVFRDFYEIWPERFHNFTNGVTQRRWLKLANPPLSDLITKTIGDRWVSDLYELKNLVPHADDGALQRKWREAKTRNKERLADYIRHNTGIAVSADSLFDCQVKRLHEYKRQLLNALHVIALYNRIKNDPDVDLVPRTVIFAGKAAPGYAMAKLIIKLITSVADVVNGDPSVGGRLKVVFLENYSVSLAERIIPAADLSEQISTAGTEASGTGNMKFALNGALTIGTLDGANIEILEEVGAHNIFIFGLTADGIRELRGSGYDPRRAYRECPELREALDMIAGGSFCPDQPGLFRPIVEQLLDHGDPFMVIADFPAYLECQERVSAGFRSEQGWARMSILNVAGMGKFSSDRTVKEYAERVWGVKPVSVNVPKRKGPLPSSEE